MPNDYVSQFKGHNNTLYDIRDDNTIYVGQVNGTIAHCPDAIDNVDFREMIVDITPIQEGSGDPSPINQRPITGRSEANITRTGKNLFNGTNVINAYLSSNGTITAGTATKMVYARCKANTVYTVSKTAGTRFSVAYTSELPVVGLQCSGYTTYFTASSITRMTGADAKYICAYVYYSSTDSGTAQEMLDSVQIEENNTPTIYEPYTGQTATINLGGTYYGGYLNVTTGLLTVTHGYIDLGSLTWGYNATRKYFESNNISNIKTPATSGTILNFAISDIYVPQSASHIYNGAEDYNYTFAIFGIGYFGISNQDYTDAPTFKAAMSGHCVVYELATPQTYQLTPAQVTQLLGENNVWADSGDINVEYYRNTSVVQAIRDLAQTDHLGFWRDDNGCLCQG